MRIGVIGTGAMGSNHTRVASRAVDYRLHALFDSDTDRCNELANRYECESSSSVEELVASVDAVIIATPTHTHRDIMQICFDAKVPFLVEKPVVGDDSEISDQMLVCKSLIMAVGHVERFNPAVRYVKQIELGEVWSFSARRESPFSNRISEGVTRDLMIHDIDLATYVMGASLSLAGSSCHATRSSTEDVSSAVLRAESGAVVSLFASRIGQTKVRDVRIVTDQFLAVLDLLQRSVAVYRQGEAEFIGQESLIYSERLTVETPLLANFAEPLAAEQQAFVESVRSGELHPELASLEDGISALAIANSVIN